MIYLYIKKHSKTGLMYFGKTTKFDPYKYNGSGKYWLSHIKKHGYEFIETVKVWEFNDQKEATKFALQFSNENNIVESKQWANLIPENALDGWNGTHSDISKIKISESMKGLKRSESTKLKQSKALKGLPRKVGKERKPLSEETRLKMSASRKGKKMSEETKKKISNSKLKRRDFRPA